MQNLMTGARWRQGRTERVVPILEKGKERLGEGQFLPQVPPSLASVWSHQEAAVTFGASVFCVPARMVNPALNLTAGFVLRVLLQSSGVGRNPQTRHCPEGVQRK